MKTYEETIDEQEIGSWISHQINALVSDAHSANLEAGWWDGISKDDKIAIAAKLALVHSEISEALEGHRKDLMDDKLPERKAIEVELADAVIRIFDLAGWLDLDLGGAFVDKMVFNASREDHKREARAAANGKKY